jgi:putative redox protein
LAAWAARYIGERPASADVAPAPAGAVIVNERGADSSRGISRMAQEVRIGRHRLAADEPVEAGGSDLGPNPYDFLLAGLGACTSMTLRLYADHKKWPLEQVRVRLSHEKIHAADCADCETKEGKIDRSTGRLRSWAMTPRSASGCWRLPKMPAHRTLHSRSDRQQARGGR